MNMVDIITKKRNGGELTKDEIEYFIQGFTEGKIPDYQISALLMSIYFKGMSPRETAYMTTAMVNSGERVDLSLIPGIKVDKHSTGGVADTTTLIAVPLAAACGVPVAKMSGRGLGHTGGTIDKLESIPGFKVSLTMQEFIDAVKTVGCAVIGQTQNLVPADKLLYSLRDVTATVDSLPLIASSIMSKKLASGADAIVLDVKTGSGAFMKTERDAFALAREMVDIGTRLNRKTIALVTGMDQPLGTAIGNALEVWEAIEVLKGEKKGPLRDVAVLLAAYMVYVGGKAETEEKAVSLVMDAMEKGLGIEKLREMIEKQQGNKSITDNKELLPRAKRIVSVKSDSEGYITSIDTQAIGYCSLILGAGRLEKDDDIDLGVGLIIKKRIGDFVGKGETLADLYVNDEENVDKAVETLKKAVTTGDKKPEEQPVLLGIVTDAGIKKTDPDS